jgi:hypothetical protein
MVRIFPLLFLFGPGVVALRQLLRRERPRWALRLAAGFALAVLLCFGAGCAVGRGPAAWSEFARNLEKHRASWLTNNVGFDNLLLYGPDTFQRRLVDWTSPEPWILWQGKMDADRAARRPLLAAAAGLFLFCLAARSGARPRSSRRGERRRGVRAPAADLLLLGDAVLTPIRGGRAPAAGALALSALLYGVHLRTDSLRDDLRRDVVGPDAAAARLALPAAWRICAARGAASG